MDLKTCEYCGTSFDASLPQCPLCGKSAEPASAEPVILKADGATAPQKRQKGGKRLAKNVKKQAVASKTTGDNPYSIPKGMMVAICVILGAAVLTGAAFAIYNLKWFAPKDTSTSSDAALQEPVTTQDEPKQPSEQQYMNEEDYTPDPGQVQETDNTPAAPVTCTKLTLGTTSVTFEEAEQFYGITYTREPADCTEEVVFSSDNESIATVNQQGKIVAVNAGSAVITAKCGTQTATCLVTCDFKLIEDEQTPAEEPKLNNEDMTFFSPGEQFSLAVKNAPEDAAITFSSSDNSVATITSGGLITAMGSGTANITVTIDGYDEPLKCIVRCNLGDSAEGGDTASGSYSISHSDVTMSLMGEYFKLRLQDADGDSVSGVSWVSSDNSVCTVDASGVVTAVGKGTATVSTTYGGATYQCIVRCNLG